MKELLLSVGIFLSWGSLLLILLWGKDLNEKLRTIFILIGLFSSVFTMFYMASTSYENGQIAAINGDIKYELVVQENNSTSWIRIKGGK